MFKFGEVTMYFDPDDVAGTATVDGGGTPAGASSQSTGDANSAATGEVSQAEKDRRAMQSVYDRKIAELERKSQEMSQKLAQYETQGLDEPARVAYERDQLKAKLAEFEARQRINDYAEAFAQRMHVPKDKLDMTSEETIVQSGWELATAHVAELEAQLEAAKTGTSSTTTQRQAPQNTTKVITGSGGVPKTVPTRSEFKANVAAKLGKQFISEDELFRWVEANPANAEAFNQWLRDQSME